MNLKNHFPTHGHTELPNMFFNIQISKNHLCKNLKKKIRKNPKILLMT